MPASTLVPQLHARIAWRPEQFNRCDNPGFESNTSGWSVAAGINGAGTSITRITADKRSGSACGRLITTATAGSGVNFDLGSDRYYEDPSDGALYAAVLWLKRESGPRICKLILGSQGTAADRDELVIQDLADDWRPYQVLWGPEAARTDAQLALVTVTGEALTVLIDDVSIFMPEGFTQVENGAFAVDTLGWAGTAGVTIQRLTTDPYVTGQAYARIDTTGGSLTNDNMSYILGRRKFTSGRTYRVRAAFRWVSGSTQPRLILGYGPSFADAGATQFTLGSTWTIGEVAWTPTADRTDGVEVRIDENFNGSGVWEVAHVEVYEATDDISSDVRTLRFVTGASFDGGSESPGSFQAELNNPDGRYTPRNTAAALYGSLNPGRPLLARCDYANNGYPLFHANLDSVQPDPFRAEASLTGVNALLSLGAVRVNPDFKSGISYAEAREHCLSQALLFGQVRARTRLNYGRGRSSLTDKSIEGSTFFDGGSGEQTLSSYLGALNAATGSIHYIRANYDAMKPWEYVTVDRATLTDDATGADTINEDFKDVADFVSGHEALENRQIITWQSYEEVIVGLDVNLGNQYTMVVQAADRGEAYDGDFDPEDPYLHFTDPRFGSSGDVPVPIVQVETLRFQGNIFTPAGGRTAPLPLPIRRPGDPGIAVPRVIYPDAFVPIAMAVGDKLEEQVSFAVPVESMEVVMFDGTTAASVLIDLNQSGLVADVSWWATAAEDITFWGISGTPFLPSVSKQVEATNPDSVLRHGQLDGQAVYAYVPSAGFAEGLGAYRNWRYGDARARMDIEDRAHSIARMLAATIGKFYTVTADRWHLSAVPMITRRIEMAVSGGGHKWEATYGLEELPTHSAFFTLDDASLGLDDNAPLAY